MQVLVLLAIAGLGYLAYQNGLFCSAGLCPPSSSPATPSTPIAPVSSQPVAVSNPQSVLVSTQTAAPPAANPASSPTTALVVFQSPSGTTFQVGQSFSLLVSGPANAPILATATLNGVPYGTNTPFGSTNANGQAVITGTFEADDVGIWAELWTVGGVQAPVIEFSVTAAQPGVSGAGNFISASLIHGGY